MFLTRLRPACARSCCWPRQASPPGPGDIALRRGLRYVYTGNVHDAEGGQTRCPRCGLAVIERDWYVIGGYRLTDGGRCLACGAALPGRYEGPVGRWGRRRLPVSIAGAGGSHR